ncbi:MAG: hypothetical protein ACRDHD_09845 [Candidatus Limnocylindria bacterium]
MTRKDDFDQTLKAWLRREAPPQAPDRVLESALDRVAAESQRRGWLQRLTGGTPMAIMLRTAAVSAVVAIAALIGLQVSNLDPNIGGSPSPTPSGSADPSASPVASVPPGSPELVLRLLNGGEGGRTHLVTVLDDGRVISSGNPGTADPIVERRLTAAGVQLVRDELDATGLTDASADYSPVANPGVEPPAYGGAGPSLEVGQPGAETVVITWFLFGDTEEDFFQPQPEAEALDALAARLTTLDDWLPASAWADATPAPYEPAAYRVLIQRQDWGGSLDDLPVEASTVEWSVDPGLDSFGEVISPLPFEQRCGVASAEDGTALLDALDAAGATVNDQAYLSSLLGERASSRVVTVYLQPILPLEAESCEGAQIPF